MFHVPRSTITALEREQVGSGRGAVTIVPAINLCRWLDFLGRFRAAAQSLSFLPLRFP